MGINRSKVWYNENQRKILVLSFCEEYLYGIIIYLFKIKL